MLICTKPPKLKPALPKQLMKLLKARGLIKTKRAYWPDWIPTGLRSGERFQVFNAITVVQGIGNTNGTGVSSSTGLQSSAFGSSITAGNTIICCTASEDGAGSGLIASAADTNGNTYTIDKSQVTAGGHDYFTVLRVSNAAGGASNKITVKPTGTAYVTILGAIEVSGLTNASPLDGSPVGTNGSSNAPAPGAFSTANTNDLLVEGYASNINTISTTVPASPGTWTRVGSYAGGMFENGDSAYQVVLATQSSINPAFSTNQSGGWACAILAYKASAGGTTFTLSASGSLTASGSLKASVIKSFAGSSAPSGALNKSTSKPFAGSITGSGALARLCAKSTAGSVACTGSLAKLVAKPLAGSVTPTGALAKQAQKPMAGSCTPTGIMSAIKVVLRNFAGSLTASGSLANSAQKSFAGSSTPSGALAKSASKPLAGSVAATGSLAKQTQKSLGGSSTPSGSLALARTVGLALAGSVTAAGALAKKILKALAGFVTGSGTLTTSGGSGPVIVPGPFFFEVGTGWCSGQQAGTGYVAGAEAATGTE